MATETPEIVRQKSTYPNLFYLPKLFQHGRYMSKCIQVYPYQFHFIEHWKMYA